MIKEHKHIVFCDEHYNPLGIVRSLGEYGIRPIVIILRGKIVLTSKSRYISQCHIVDTMEKGYKLLLKLYGNEDKKPFLYTSDDTKTSYLDEHYNELKDKFYFYNAGEEGRINYYMNKENIGLLALKHGLNFLKAITVERGIIPQDIEYPVITKALDSRASGWKKDMYICNSAEELKQALENISSSVVMIQKYILKKNEYCIEGLSVNRGKDVFLSIASTYNYLLPDSYSPYMTVRNFDRMDIKPKVEAMFSEIGFEGIFEVEFLIDQDDKLYFGEINFRNSTWSYASTCAGMNLPVLWAQGMLSGEIDDSCYEPIKNGFTAMVELTDFKYRVLGHKISLLKWLADYKNSDCKYYVGRNDIRPVILMLLKKVFKY